MIDKKALLYTIFFAALLGAFIALGARFLFSEWANENPVILAAVIGALCGLIYPVFARQTRT